MSLIHDVPTGLRTRPTVSIRQIPGQTIRVPARAGTLLLGAVILWGIGVVVTPVAWTVLAGGILIPATILAALIELKPRGKAPLAWAYVLIRATRRAPVLIVTRQSVASSALAPHGSSRPSRRRTR